MHGGRGRPVGRRRQGQDRRRAERGGRRRRPLPGGAECGPQHRRGRGHGGAPPRAFGRHASGSALPDWERRRGRPGAAARGGGRPRGAAARGALTAGLEPRRPSHPPLPSRRGGGRRARSGGDWNHRARDRIRLPRQGRAHRRQGRRSLRSRVVRRARRPEPVAPQARVPRGRGARDNERGGTARRSRKPPPGHARCSPTSGRSSTRRWRAVAGSCSRGRRAPCSTSTTAPTRS